jgi:hypothetical protein
MEKQTKQKPAETKPKPAANLAERFGRTPDGRIKAGPGRRKGVPNALSGQAKDNIAAVFDRLGGVDEMLKWAEANPSEFYVKVYPRLLPLQVQGQLEQIQKNEHASAALERILTGIIEARRQESDRNQGGSVH